MDSRINKLFLDILDLECEWGCRVDNVVKAFFFVPEYVIEGAVYGNI